MTFSNRHDVESHLAEISDGGVIVECGVGFGDGLVALMAGNKAGRLLPIFAIDPYIPYVDRLGGTYGPECKAIAMEKLDGTRWVSFIEEDGLTVAQKWELPVALAWIDVSMNYEDLKPIFEAWDRHIIADGHIAIAGFDYPNLGTAQVAQEAVESGRYEMVLTEQNFAAVLRRKPDYKRAVFYIVDGGRYAKEASYSAGSVKERMPGVETFLFAVGGTSPKPNIDHVLPLTERQDEYWYLDSTRYFNVIVETLKDYERLLYLDTDTWMASPCMDMWWLLDNYDLCLGHSAGRDTPPTALGTPSGFSILSIGVNLFKNNEAVRATFADWLDYFKCYRHIYENYDEAALRDVLFRNEHKLQLYILPPEYTLRAGFGCWIYGKVRIVHARLPNLRTIGEDLNAITVMRLWRPEDGFLWYHGQ